MTTLTRRSLLRTSALVPVALVGGCEWLRHVVTVLPTYLSNLDLIASFLEMIGPSVAKLVGVSQATIDKVRGWIAEARVLADKIAAMAKSGGNNAGSLALQFAGVVGDIVDALGGHVPAGMWADLQAGISLLPSILAAFGITASRRMAMRVTMSPDEARARLRAALGR